MSGKKPKELDYIGVVPKPGDSVWTIGNGYALEHIVTNVYSPEGFFVCSVRYPHEKKPFRNFDAADMYICKQWFLNREDAEDALDEIEKRRGGTAITRPECARPRNPGSCYHCLYSYIPEGFDGGCMIAEEKWKLRPKKPVFRENDACQCELNHCPTCGHIVEGEESGERFAYCPHCGQRIDWGAAERDALGGKEGA